MKKDKSILSLVLIFLLLFSFTSIVFADQDIADADEENRQEIIFDFDDSDEAPWAGEYIGKMQSKNVIKGYGDGTFRPNAPVTRLEAIVMAIRLMELEAEALTKPADMALHFQDAKQIPDWGRGYVIVALEKGLFNATEDKIQANKPASRVWIVQLLVKALGLEQEALSKMTNIPDFKDISAIPAGSIGYVNVAVEREITTGYDDHTFRPNQPVTRGEMATFLDRTNDGLLERSGANTVQGTIKIISFDENSTVTNEVYRTTDGSITIETVDGDESTYTISSSLLVQCGKHFMRAHQLREGDAVTLIIKDGIVLEANLINQEQVNTLSNLLKLKIKLKFAHQEEIMLQYKNKNGKIDAQFEVKTNKQKVKAKGQGALAEVEELMAQLSLSAHMTKEEIVASILSVFQVEENKLAELDMDATFTNGKEITMELKNDDVKEVDILDGGHGIQEFKLKVELTNQNRLELNYKNEKEKVEAEVEQRIGKNKEKAKGHEAVEVLEQLFDQLSLTAEMSKEQIIAVIFNQLQIDENQLKEAELEIKFSNGTKIELDFENENGDDETNEKIKNGKKNKPEKN